MLDKIVGADNGCCANRESVGHSIQEATIADVKARVSWRGQEDIVSRFWSRVKKTHDCWWWTGTICSRYGQISLGHPSTPGSKRWKTHRFSWELHFGPVPAGLKVCHRCDNPLCVRPDHLFLGTQRDNVHDSIHKNRRNAFGRQKLNVEDVRIIRAQAHAGILQKDIAQAFRIATSAVSMIVNRKAWAHVADVVPEKGIA